VGPARGRGNNEPPQDYGGEEDEREEEEDKEAEPLTGEKIKQAEPLIQIFREPNVRKIFSKTW